MKEALGREMLAALSERQEAERPGELQLGEELLDLPPEQLRNPRHFDAIEGGRHSAPGR